MATKKQTTLTARERLELKKTPDVLYVEVMDVKEDAGTDEKALEDAYIEYSVDLDDRLDGSFVTEYRAVKRFRVERETKTHQIPVTV